MGLRIVILGGPGAGKGTQAMRIAEAREIPHISTGAIFRGHMEQNSELGRAIRPYMDAGQLVPDDLTCRVVEQRLQQDDCRNGYILDGFPRTLPQARTLDELLERRGDRLDVVIELDVPDDEIVDRLSARRTCPACGKIFNLKFDPPATGNSKCDRPDCTGELVTRPDDREETVRQRIKVYHETTQPILEYYRERGLLRSVNSDALAPEAVFVKVEEILCAVSAA